MPLWGIRVDRTYQEEYVFGAILHLANKLQMWGDSIIEDMTIKQWFLLILISKMNVQNPTVKEIADFSGSSRQNTKKILEQLENKKYVQITGSKTDERALNVKLSEKTWKYFTANEKKAADSVNKLFTNITNKELSFTYKTLEKLLMMFDIKVKLGEVE